MFIEVEAESYAFAPDSIDVVISRLGVRSFEDPTAAFTNIAGGLRAGGRVAFVCWADLASNDWMVVPSTAVLAHVPPPDFDALRFGKVMEFGDEDRVTSILQSA